MSRPTTVKSGKCQLQNLEDRVSGCWPCAKSVHRLARSRFMRSFLWVRRVVCQNIHICLMPVCKCKRTSAFVISSQYMCANRRCTSEDSVTGTMFKIQIGRNIKVYPLEEDFKSTIAFQEEHAHLLLDNNCMRIKDRC